MRLLLAMLKSYGKIIGRRIWILHSMNCHKPKKLINSIR